MEQLKQMKTEVIEILKLGYMELVKWHSNLPEFVDDQTMKDLNIDDGFVTSALGVEWDQRRDVFIFTFKHNPSLETTATKQSILSKASTLFDPLGLLSFSSSRRKFLYKNCGS